MNTSPLIRTALATLLGSLALGAGACPMNDEGMPPMMHGDHGAMPMMQQMRALKLSDAQQDTLFTQRQAQAKARHEAMRAAGKSMEALHALAQSDKFDADKARSLANEHGRQVAEMSFLHAQAEAQLRETLTPEQRKQLDAMAAAHRGPDGDRHDGKACRGMKGKG